MDGWFGDKMFGAVKLNKINRLLDLGVHNVYCLVNMTPIEYKVLQRLASQRVLHCIAEVQINITIINQ